LGNTTSTTNQRSFRLLTSLLQEISKYRNILNF